MQINTKFRSLKIKQNSVSNYKETYYQTAKYDRLKQLRQNSSNPNASELSTLDDAVRSRPKSTEANILAIIKNSSS